MQTALQQAIEQIRNKSKYNTLQYQLACDDNIAILTALLEYERDVIHEAYETGHMGGREGFPPDKADCYKQITND